MKLFMFASVIFALFLLSGCAQTQNTNTPPVTARTHHEASFRIACDRPSKTCQVFFDVRAEFFLERGARVTSHFAVDRYIHAE